ncbi:MAG: hypothetical protein HYW28_05045 [Rhodospirillales bacterium]|nr:hypothetical protein [Rhodospirillales bacterium]
MNKNRRLQRMFDANEGSHAPNDELETRGELERAVLAMYAVEPMVPLFNRLIEHGYLTGAEHAEFLQRYKLLAKHLFPRASTVENQT